MSVSGPLIVNDAEFLIRAALDGVGLAFLLEDYVAEHIACGALVRVLEELVSAVRRRTFSTTRAGVINRRRCRRWSTPLECDPLFPAPARRAAPGEPDRCRSTSTPSETTPLCEIKGVTHAPAFRVHSTEFEGLAPKARPPRPRRRASVATRGRFSAFRHHSWATRSSSLNPERWRASRPTRRP